MIYAHFIDKLPCKGCSAFHAYILNSEFLGRELIFVLGLIIFVYVRTLAVGNSVGSQVPNIVFLFYRM